MGVQANKRIPGLTGLKTNVSDANVVRGPYFAAKLRLICPLAVTLIALLLLKASFSWYPNSADVFLFRLSPSTVNESDGPKDELQSVLEKASTDSKTVIISVLNKAYVEDGMLDLFLRSMREGEGTELLIKHLILVAVDQVSFKRCQDLGLHCYQLKIEGIDFSKELVFMSKDFNKMMWGRIHFLGGILKRGYNFIFTDMDILWLRNPLKKLTPDEGDLQISCDRFNGRAWDTTNGVNTGFYFAVSNNKTMKLFDEWYRASHNGTSEANEQMVLNMIKNMGTFNYMGLRVKFLHTIYFSGFCEKSRDFRAVCTVHANCCKSAKAKLTDLTEVLDVWKKFNSSATATWPEHKACRRSW